MLEESDRVSPPFGFSNLRILLIQKMDSHAESLYEVISKVTPKFSVVFTACLADTLEALTITDFDALVIDLSPPDDETLNAIRCIQQHVGIPSIILMDSADDALAFEILQAGAEDVLAKPDVTSDLFYRVVRYAVARYRRRGELKRLSLIDELTGLYNRRGFITVGEQQLKISRRENTGVAVAFADLDGLKAINDQFGHSQGDLALKDIANVLKTTFRESDVLARIGGDEFAILWSGDSAVSANVLLNRLKRNVETYATSERRSFNLSLSIGFSHFAHGFTQSLDEMLIASDERMYEEKRRCVAAGSDETRDETRKEVAAGISIIVGSDVPRICRHLNSSLTPASDLRVVGTADGPKELVHLANVQRPDIAIVSFNLRPNRLTRLVSALAAEGVRPVLVSDALEDAQAVELLRSGLVGILPTAITREMLRHSINLIAAGEIWIPRHFTGRLINEFRRSVGSAVIAPKRRDNQRSAAQPSAADRFRLTRRELQIVQALSTGLSNKDIAEALGVSQHTVQTHLGKIFDKLGVYNRLELATFAVYHGLCQPVATEEVRESAQT